MLETIQIKNFAIIDDLQLEFGQGMTALTGETGAGKSILLDAIQLVLGDRADSDSVKSGSEKADISVTFNISNHAKAIRWLSANELGDQGECLIRRVIHNNGRSKAFINGCASTLSQLKQLGELLVDLHGQHEHQSLQKPQVQQQLLDDSIDHPELFANVSSAYQEWQLTQKALNKLLDNVQHKQQRIDLLQLYADELNDLNLQTGEIEKLNEEYQRLSHVDELFAASSGVLNKLYEADELTIQSQLSSCLQDLSAQCQYDKNIKSAFEMINNALIQIEEASAELRTFQDQINRDPARIDELNTRIASAQVMARKHQVSTQQLPDLTATLNTELEQLLNAGHNIEDLEKQSDQKKSHFLELAGDLSTLRQQAATQLSAQISQLMQELGMQGGQFSIEVTENTQNQGFSSKGFNQVIYLVSTNPGQSLKPLTRVASGGELSRISLALQVILSDASEIPTLIFDEVDSGIGGGVAEIVGNKLRLLGQKRQVFCVTHLAQVASQAHHHFRVEKLKSELNTLTQVTELNPQQRLEEVARMLGGVTITEQTRATASEMLAL